MTSSTVMRGVIAAPDSKGGSKTVAGNASAGTQEIPAYVFAAKSVSEPFNAPNPIAGTPVRLVAVTPVKRIYWSPSFAQPVDCKNTDVAAWTGIVVTPALTGPPSTALGRLAPGCTIGPIT